MDYFLHFKRFGLCSLVLVSLSACTYLIPDDPSAPRYNVVLGERHAPSANNVAPTEADIAEEMGMSPEAILAYDVPPAQPIAAAPIEPVFAAPLPPQMPPSYAAASPYPPYTAPAPAPYASPYPLAAAPPPYDLPPVGMLDQSQAQRDAASMTHRQTPYENYAMPPMQVAAGALNSVPQRPPLWGPDSARRQLESTRQGLEQERQDMGYARDRLNRDAAAEPRLSPEPTGAIPYAPPAPSQPVGAPQSNRMPTGLMPPPPPLAMQAPVSMPVAPIQLQAPPYRPMTTARASASPPIMLTPPTGQVLGEPYYAASAGGDFDPLADAAGFGAAPQQTTYSGTGYMPQPRYRR